VDLEQSFGVPIELVPVERDALLDAIRRAYSTADALADMSG
jgi:hypothetical protein